MRRKIWCDGCKRKYFGLGWGSEQGWYPPPHELHRTKQMSLPIYIISTLWTSWWINAMMISLHVQHLYHPNHINHACNKAPTWDTLSACRWTLITQAGMHVRMTFRSGGVFGYQNRNPNLKPESAPNIDWVKIHPRNRNPRIPKPNG
jgi:hypothetical protein